MPDLEDYGALLRSGAASVPDYAAQEAQNQLRKIQLSEAQRLATQQQQQIAEQKSFQTDLTGVLAHPSPENYSALMAKHPTFAASVKDSWNLLDKSRQDADFKSASEVYSAAANGKYDVASGLMQQRLDADKQAGQDTTHDQAILDALKSNDPTQQKAALGMMGVTLSAIAGPDKFNETLGQLTKDKGYTLGQGQTHFDENNQPVASVAAKPDFLVVPEGGKAVPLNPAAVAAGAGQVGGGGQASPGAVATAAPGTVARTHGYTPRQRDGGDNPDNVVDNKIAALSKAVGVDPDTPMNPQQFAAFSRALPGTENASGNNVGGIKDGSFAKAQPGYTGANGQYATFATPEDGQAAMQKLLTSRFYNRGQQSIRDIIEGKPKGQPTAAAAPSQAQPGDVPGTIYGNAKPQARMLNSAEAQARGLDTAKAYELHPDGTVSAVGDADQGDFLKQYGITPSMSGPDMITRLPPNLATQVKALAEGRLPMPSSFALAKPYWQRLLQMTAQYDPTFDAANAPARKAAITAFTGMGKGAQVVSSVNRVANHLQTLWNESAKLAGPETGWSVTNKLLAGAGQSFEPADAKAYDTAVGFVAGELEKIARNSPGTESGVERVVNNLGRKNSADTRKSAIKTAVDIIAGAVDPLKDQYNSAFTNDSTRPRIPWVTPQAQRIFQSIGGTNGGVDLSLTGGNADTNSPEAGSGTLRIQTAEQWHALKPGTRYIDPSGVARIKH